MRILVTGSAGFIGSHLMSRLDEVTGVDIRCAWQGCEFLHDARDYFRHENQRFDLVIHCAALVGGRGLVANSPVA